MQDLIMIHGAIGSKQQLAALGASIGDNFKIHIPDLPGHGGRIINENDFTIKHYALDLLSYMDQQQIQQAAFFGYSMGGYVAMYIARHFPERMTTLICFATKYQWNETVAAAEIKMLDPEKIQLKIPAFAKELSERHAPQDWKKVLEYTCKFLMNNGNKPEVNADDFSQINTPSLLMVGDRDKLVTLEETVEVYRSMSNATLSILPATAHPIEQVDTTMLALMIQKFIS